MLLELPNCENGVVFMFSYPMIFICDIFSRFDEVYEISRIVHQDSRITLYVLWFGSVDGGKFLDVLR